MQKKDFRFDISALRALAVLIVILFHFKVPPFKGGFIGVDVFFVISGFLMTQIILAGFLTKKFSLLQFYSKRVQRIIPPLLFLLLVLGSLSFFLLKNDIIKLLRLSLVSELFFSNIFFIKNSSYFDDFSQNNILLHTWSLAVEWQFYMVYPIILLLFRKLYLKRTKIFILLFISFIAISFAYMLYMQNVDSSANFYSFPTRAWEMMAGGAAFLFKNLYSIKNLSLKKAKYIVFTCFAVIIISSCSITESAEWPSLLTLIPVAATGLILLLNLDFKFYHWSALKFTGDISYSLYLWHWPLYVFTLYFGIKYNGLTVIILIILSFVFATISYKSIERNKKISNTNYILVVLSFFAIGHYSLYKYILPKYYHPSEKEYDGGISWEEQTRAPYHCNLGMDAAGAFDYDGCLKMDFSKKNFLLIGDSHAGAIAKSMYDILAKNNINMLQLTSTGEGPLIGRKYKSQSMTDKRDYLFNEFIPKNSKNIEAVVISMYYSPKLDSDIIENLIETERYLQKYDIKTIIIGENESYNLSYEQIQMLRDRYGSLINEQNYLKYHNDIVSSKLHEYFGSRYIDIKNKVNRLNGNKIYMFDNNHFTIYGADQVANIFEDKILK